jgi:hypothetical protein
LSDKDLKNEYLNSIKAFFEAEQEQSDNKKLTIASNE